MGLVSNGLYEEIGYTVFSFDVPCEIDELKNSTAEGDVDGYNFSSVSLQFWNNTELVACYFELQYFPNGAPPDEVAYQVFTRDFEQKARGRVFAVNESYASVAGYPAKVWDVYHPMTRRPGFIAKLRVDDQRVVNILADPAMFSSFQTLQVRIGSPIETDPVVWFSPRCENTILVEDHIVWFSLPIEIE